MFRLTLAAAVGCTVGTAVLADDWRSEFANITFGIASGENQQAGNLRWAPMGPYLADCMGIESVTMRVANDYSAIIEGMAQGDIHIAWYGPAQYAIIHDLTDGDVEPVVVDISLDGDMGYRWVIAVKSDSPYQTIEDLRGRTLGWSTPTSASGYVLPMQYFREMGYVDETNEPVLFGNMLQTGSHDNGLVSVVQGNIDATTNWYYSINAGAHVRAAGAGTMNSPMFLRHLRVSSSAVVRTRLVTASRSSHACASGCRTSRCNRTRPAWLLRGSDRFAV